MNAYTNCIIETSGITKTFVMGHWKKRRTEALRGVDLCVRTGEIFGILGPNGAGKTTLMNILISLLRSDSGVVRVMGREVTHRFPASIKRRMNMCSGNPNFPWSLRPSEILRFYAMLYGVPRPERDRRIERYLHEFELERYADVHFDELSSGTKQKIALAKSLLNDPEILLLDEPTVGLDPDIALKTRELIRRIHAERGITILLTTHYMREAEELCDRVAFIRQGRMVALGTRDELTAMTKTADLEGVFLELAHP